MKCRDCTADAKYFNSPLNGQPVKRGYCKDCYEQRVRRMHWEQNLTIGTRRRNKSHGHTGGDGMSEIGNTDDAI